MRPAKAIPMEKREYEIMYAHENAYWWYRGLHELVEKHIRRHAGNAISPLTILDAGCGTGRMMELARRYGAVEGFDFSRDALQFCARRGLDSVSCQDLNDWTPPQEKYDIIICLDVLCHKSIGDDRKIFHGFRTALKANGLLIANLPAFEKLRRRHDTAVHTRKRYTKKDTVQMLEKEGFHILCSSYRLPFLYGVMLMKKCFEHCSPSAEIKSDLASLPSWLNNLLLFHNRAENAVIFSGISLPLGSSLFIVGQK